MQGLEGGTESVLSRTRRSSQAFEDQAQTALLSILVAQRDKSGKGEVWKGFHKLPFNFSSALAVLLR